MFVTKLTMQGYAYTKAVHSHKIIGVSYHMKRELYISSNPISSGIVIILSL